MRVKILVVAILIVLFTPVFIVHSTNNDSESFVSQDKKVVEIPESIGYCFPFDGIDLNYFDLVPNLNVAIDVALPILENIYKKSFKEYMPFKGYLKMIPFGFYMDPQHLLLRAVSLILKSINIQGRF